MIHKRAFAYWNGAGRTVALLLIGGALAGFCNGLLGAGGGIVLCLALSRLVGGDGEGSRSIYANALCVMLPLSLLTLFRYAQAGALSNVAGQGLSSPYVLGAIIGGLLGGVLLGRLQGRGLRRLFALLTLISGILMITR